MSSFDDNNSDDESVAAQPPPINHHLLYTVDDLHEFVQLDCRQLDELRRQPAFVVNTAVAEELALLARRLARVRDHYLPVLRRLEQLIAEKREHRLRLVDQLTRFSHDWIMEQLRHATDSLSPPRDTVDVPALTATLANLLDQLCTMSHHRDRLCSRVERRLEWVAGRLFRAVGPFVRRPITRRDQDGTVTRHQM